MTEGISSKELYKWFKNTTTELRELKERIVELENKLIEHETNEKRHWTDYSKKKE